MLFIFRLTVFPPRTRRQAAEASGKKLSSEGEVLLEGRPRAPEASFLRALMATFSSSFLLSMGFKLIQDLLSFINPQLLRSVHAPSHMALPGTRGWPGG